MATYSSLCGGLRLGLMNGFSAVVIGCAPTAEAELAELDAAILNEEVGAEQSGRTPWAPLVIH